MGSRIITINPSDMQGDGAIQHIAKASVYQGGFTVIDAYAVNGAATDEGTAFSLVLQNYGASGTVAGGTVGSCGGTADVFAANTPKQFSLTAANVFLDGGEWLVLKKTEENSSDLDAEATVVIEVVDGVVTQG